MKKESVVLNEFHLFIIFILLIIILIFMGVLSHAWSLRLSNVEGDVKLLIDNKTIKEGFNQTLKIESFGKPLLEFYGNHEEGKNYEKFLVNMEKYNSVECPQYYKGIYTAAYCFEIKENGTTRN